MKVRRTTTGTIGICLLLLAVSSCASPRRPAEDTAPVPVPPAEQQQERAALEARIGELQTSMTELLERIDVLNDRINRMESGVAGTAPRSLSEVPPAVRPVPAPAQPAAERRQGAPSKALASAQIADTYRNALMAYGRGKMDEARRTFQQVFDADPTGELADNALYWIGETFFATGNYSEAMRYYHRVTTEYSDQNKAPDALFKTALTYEKTSDLGMARTTLEEVLRRYPYSTAAASAKLELKRIKY